MNYLACILCTAILFVGCKDGTESNSDATTKAANDLFAKNSEIVMANIRGWEAENLDYSMYAEDFVMRETGFGAERDSLNLGEMKEFDRQIWDSYDFKVVSDIVLLPGVHRDSKEMDGSVRHYIDWEVTHPATDSTEARSGVIKLYESYDFDENGKISYQQVYGDFTGLMNHLMGKE